MHSPNNKTEIDGLGEQTLNPKFSLQMVEFSIHDANTKDKEQIENNLKEINRQAQGKPVMKTVIQERQRGYPMIDQILSQRAEILKNKEIEAAGGVNPTSMATTTTNQDNTLNMWKQAAANKKHGLLTYNESERNKKANSLVPKSVINRQLNQLKEMQSNKNQTG